METQTARRTNRRRARSRKEDSRPLPDAFTLAGLNGTRPRLALLDDGAVETLKARALQLLEDHGVVLIHPAAVAALKKAGARPGRDADRWRLPRELVQQAVDALPRQVTLAGKTPGRDMHLPRADGGFIMRSGTGAHGYVDPETGRYRNLDLKAVTEIATLCDGLDQVGFVAHPFVHGVPEITADIHSLARLIRHTDKHVWIQPYAKENVEYLLRIAAIAAGGEDGLRQRPLASCITCSFSPLEFKYMDTEVIIQAGRLGVPVHACSLPSAGGTAPLSSAGLVLMATAEILSMTTVAHVLSPGLPVIATPLMFSLDMRTGSALQSSAETLQAAGMAIQVMKQGFGLPAHTYGAGSDTPDVDVQSMAERALIAQTVALSGADILGGVGQLECATVFSPVQAVLDNEIGAMLRRFMEVPRITDDMLNWEETASIRAGGHFLDSTDTLMRCRDQLSPKAFLRQGRDDYEASGRRTALDQARDQALALIHAAPEHGVLGDDAIREIDRLVADADRHIVGGVAKTAGHTDII